MAKIAQKNNAAPSGNLNLQHSAYEGNCSNDDGLCVVLKRGKRRKSRKSRRDPTRVNIEAYDSDSRWGVCSRPVNGQCRRILNRHFNESDTTCGGRKAYYSSSVGKLDQAGSPASACTVLYRQKGKINPGDTGSQPKHLHIKGDI
jgi:hypothetical protein